MASPKRITLEWAASPFKIAGMFLLVVLLTRSFTSSSSPQVGAITGAVSWNLTGIVRNTPIGQVITWGAQGWAVPIQVTMENGGKVPVFALGAFPTLRLTRVADGAQIEVPLHSAAGMAVPSAPNNEYRVTVENLPNAYSRSIRFEAIDLATDALKFPSPSALIETPNTRELLGSTINLAGEVWTGSAVSPIVVTLAKPPQAHGGVRLAGSAGSTGSQTVYISGNPGVFYSDGTFEFEGVSPGVQTVVSRARASGGRVAAATVVVGDNDISGIELQEVAETPLDPPRLNTANRTPGLTIPLVSIRGRVVDEATSQWVDTGRVNGSVTVNGNTTSYSVNGNGEFEIPRLLSGRYDLQIQIYGHGTFSKSVVVIDADVRVDVPVRLAETAIIR
jgi:hypothetical protein